MQQVAAALGDLTSDEAATPAIVRPRLPPTRAVRGPASLFYPPDAFSIDEVPVVEEVSAIDVQMLARAVSREELHESGVLDTAGGPIFGSRAPTGALAAVCGYRRWPNDVAHLSVLAHPGHRRDGHGRRAALAAIHRVLDEKLLPQWRARPVASRALARDLGLIELGAQLSLEPA